VCRRCGYGPQHHHTACTPECATDLHAAVAAALRAASAEAAHTTASTAGANTAGVDRAARDHAHHDAGSAGPAEPAAPVAGGASSPGASAPPGSSASASAGSSASVPVAGRGATQRTAAYRRAGTVDLIVSLPTLMGLSDDPGLLPGWGPVLAELARQIAAEARQRWHANIYNGHGRLIARKRIRARVTEPTGSVAAERAFVKARDKTCRYPGCRVPAKVCDIDHTIERRHGGRDHRDENATCCPYHHQGRHRHGFEVIQLEWGVLQWTTPLGHTYTTEPETPPF